MQLVTVLVAYGTRESASFNLGRTSMLCIICVAYCSKLLVLHPVGYLNITLLLAHLRGCSSAH